jgi:hypothetical protein
MILNKSTLFCPWKSVGISTQDVLFIVIVMSPLNSLIQDQISGLKSSGLRASAISINIRKEIFHGEITIGLHILRLNRGC